MKRRSIPPFRPEGLALAINEQAHPHSVVHQIVRKWWILGIGIIAIMIVTFAFHRAKSNGAPGAGPGSDSTETESNSAGAPSDVTAVRVDVIRPSVGNMSRSISEPGTVKAFQYADLYAKVSGYLEIQNVDIGDAVKPGELLAKISAPELEQAVEQAKAQLVQAKSQVNLAVAAIDRAKADLEAAHANVSEKEADLKRETAYLAYRQIQYERIKKLFDLKAVEEKLVDQNLKERDAALEAQNAAKAAIKTADAEVAAKQAKIVEAEADLANARAKVQVAAAQLAKSKVFMDYLEIRSPYQGVVTKRMFHVGDFIRAADQGGASPVPLLRVARTDKMRVELKMPETYVPYTDPGDPATVELDALPGKEFHVKVARIGNSLDPENRTMRVEVDVDNNSNELRDGMFGRVTIQLTRSTKEMSIPSTCQVSSTDGTKTSVFVVQGGKLTLRPVKVGRDTGVRVEILSGLKPDELVVRHPTPDLFAGEKVVPVETPNTGADPTAPAK
jgi:HlyD family secretion protein